MIRLAAFALALAACSPKVVELGNPDAAIDAMRDAASSCRCRIMPCRTAADCTLIGGACGPDAYCVGDFGACTTSATCQATAADSVCTQGATSTAACP